MLREVWASVFAWVLTESLESREGAAKGVLCDLDSVRGYCRAGLFEQLDGTAKGVAERQTDGAISTSTSSR